MPYVYFRNFTNAVFKGAVWMLTGSPSIFSEFMHSIGDIMNQVIVHCDNVHAIMNCTLSYVGSVAYTNTGMSCVKTLNILSKSEDSWIVLNQICSKILDSSLKLIA